MTHPDLFLAEPSLRDLPFYRVPGKPYHKPPEGDLGPEIGISNSPNRSARDQTLHELSHELARLNDWPRGGDPREFADGGPLAYLRLPGESPQAAYLRMLGERESNVVVKRAEMTPAQLQAETPEATMFRERSSGKFPPGPSIRVPFGLGWWNVGQRPQPIGPAPVPPTMPRVSLAELWPREANLALAQAHARGGSAVTIAQQLNRQLGSNAYTSRLVGNQIERLRLNPTRQSQATVQESWQPDALALLTSPGAWGMTAQQLADLIYRETDQVTTKGAVTGKLNRLHAEKMRQQLAEDLAMARSTTLRATGVPLTGWDALMPEDEVTCRRSG